MNIIRITDSLSIDANEVREHFIRASGPGGQNVNKVSTAVQLRFDVANSISLSDDVRRRLIRLAGRRITESGVLIINARRFRAQQQNRDDALNRLVALIRMAAEKPILRRKTHPTPASGRRRLEAKRQRAEIKQLRQHRDSDEY